MVREDQQWLSVHKAAALLGVHPNTIRRWAHQEKLAGTRIGGRGDWRFSREALQQFMKNGNEKSSTTTPSLVLSRKHHTQALSSPSSMGMLAHGGEMGARMQSLDWSKTPVGEIGQWPTALATLVTTSLRSRFPIVIWWGRQHYTTFYNDAYIPFLGKTKHPWWLGRSGRECWHEIWPTIGPMLESVFETGRPTWSEDLLLVLDRNLPFEEGYFTFSYSAIVGEIGTVDGIFCVCKETTEQVLSERRLWTLRDLSSRASEARSAEEACEIAARLLSSNNADIPFALIYLLDRDHTTAHLVALSGLSARSQAAPATIALSSSTVSIWPLFSVAQTGKPELVVLRAADFGPLPGGCWPESPDTALVLPLNAPEQNQVTGFLVVGVSPRRILDEPYRDFFQLVSGHVATAVANARAYEEERKRAEALAELDRAKTLFFSNISHEFRTPLTLMLGPLEDLSAERATLSSAQGEHIELLQRNTLRLARLVNTLLDFSRLEAGRMEVVYELVDLAALTTDLSASFRSAIEKAGMTLMVICPPKLPLVYVDQQMWEKIVLNLLSNAFKYTFEGTITVRLEQKETTVELAVQDTGVGIPAEELPHMFERFHRVKGTQGRTYEGTGIGLSLVYELVKLHAGSIAVTSTPGQGSTFTISLPLGSAHLPAERIAAGRTIPSTAVSASTYVEEALQLLTGQDVTSDLLADIPLTANGRQPSPDMRADKGEQRPTARILFADDNADMRAYVSRLFQPHYEVLTAPDGKAALASVQQSPPDLVLADVMMPGMDGFELLQRLRSNAATSNMPVILLSARAGEEAQIEGMVAGADDYLIKPFSARELLARVEARLEIARLRQANAREVVVERERLFSLFQQAPAAIAVLYGSTFRYELANPLYQQIFHRTEQQLVGKTVREVLPEVEGQGIFELLETVFASGTPYIANQFPATFERLETGVLETAYFNLIAQPLRGSTGQVERIMLHAVEITEQIVARKRAEESEARFHTLADNISQFAWMADETGWIFWYNQRWYDYTGTNLQAMQGWGWQKVHHPDHVERVVEKISHCFATGEVWEDTFPLRGKDGTYRWFLSRAIPIRDEQGRVIRWFGTNTDITERKQLEQQKDDFIGVANHELKTPVTSIKAYVQLLEHRFRQGGDIQSAALLQKMDTQLNKLTGLVEDLLDVTRIENGQLLFHFSSFDFNELINEVIEETQRTATRHTIMQDLAPPVSLYADRERIGQVLTNLLTNAIKYAPEAQIVLVKTTCTADAIIISVQDFGIGIPKEKLPHLFERFYRVEGDNQATYPGMGLGLYISATFIRRHHGSIWVESEEGQGTTVFFSLPLQHLPEEQQTKEERDDATPSEKNLDCR